MTNEDVTAMLNDESNEDFDALAVFLSEQLMQRDAAAALVLIKGCVACVTPARMNTINRACKDVPLFQEAMARHHTAYPTTPRSDRHLTHARFVETRTGYIRKALRNIEQELTKPLLPFRVRYLQETVTQTLEHLDTVDASVKRLLEQEKT